MESRRVLGNIEQGEEYTVSEPLNTSVVDARTLAAGLILIILVAIGMCLFAWYIGGAGLRYECAQLGGKLVFSDIVGARPICIIQ